jgi:ketosteroid isomerase-like protein
VQIEIEFQTKLKSKLNSRNMTHSNEEILRAAYAEFAHGELNGYLQYCTDNISFRVPGKGKISGTYKRDEFISPWVSGVIELTNGTFRETVSGVVANDDRGVVLATHEFERNGRKFKYDTAHIYRIKDGKLDSFEEYPADLYYFDEAWS